MSVIANSTRAGAANSENGMPGKRPRVRGRYLHSQKLSNYMIERVLMAFVSGESATSFSASPAAKGISRNTIFKLYDLTRRRLLDIGYFEEPKDYYQFWMEDEERKSQFGVSEHAHKIAEHASKVDGASATSARYVLAEAIFRAENSDLPAAAFLQDIKLIVKLTGPLNRPPVNVPLWRERARLIELDREIGSLRRDPHRSTPDLVDSLDVLRSGSIARLRRMMRVK